MALGKKQSEILFEVVRCYIKSGGAVGSVTLAESMAGEQRASTLRYNLGKLEEQGYIRKAHSSSGRLPTDKAYRAFVRAILDEATISREEELRIRNALGSVERGLKSVIGSACEVMARHTDLMSIVVSPEPNRTMVDVIKLVALSANTLLVAVVTGDDASHTQIVHLPIEVSRLDLATLERSLNAALVGKKLYDINETTLSDIFNRANLNQFLVLNIRRPFEEFLKQLRFSGEGRIQVKGRDKIVSRVESDPDQIRSVLGLIDDEKQLVSLLTTLEGGPGVRALIGSDFTNEGLDRVAMIYTDFQALGGARGQIGVIGPRRMEYERIIPLVKLISEVLEDRISGQTLVLE